VTGSGPIAEVSGRLAATAARPASAIAPPSANILSGLNPKARLMQLCARIGYTPHASFQR
jgi:hypothetical protein